MIKEILPLGRREGLFSSFLWIVPWYCILHSSICNNLMTFHLNKNPVLLLFFPIICDSCLLFVLGWEEKDTPGITQSRENCKSCRLNDPFLVSVVVIAKNVKRFYGPLRLHRPEPLTAKFNTWLHNHYWLATFAEWPYINHLTSDNLLAGLLYCRFNLEPWALCVKDVRRGRFFFQTSTPKNILEVLSICLPLRVPLVLWHSFAHHYLPLLFLTYSLLAR